MKVKRHILSPVIATLLITLFLFIAPPDGAAEESSDMSLIQKVLFVEGTIRKFSRKQQTLKIKTSQKEKMDILVHWKTTLVGYSSLHEIKRGHGVKIWYTVEKDKNRAVKIEKKLEVGC